jgi:hypothetical protein
MRGNCPEAEALAGFVDNSLPKAEADKIAHHLIVCGLCAHEAAVLRQSLNPELQAAGDEGARAARVGERFRRFLLQQDRTAPPRRGLPRMLAAVAAAVILLLLYPAYLGLRQLLPGMIPAETSVHIVRLEPALRDAGAAPSIQARRNAYYLGLMFFVPLPGSLPAQLDCRLQRGGRIVHAVRNLESFDGLGNFLLMVPFQSLETTQDYLLTVSASGDASRTWQFRFFLEKPPS